MTASEELIRAGYEAFNDGSAREPTREWWQEVREGDRGVFAWVHFTGHGAGSGLAMEMHLAHVWQVQDGKLKRVEEYFDRDEGLAAAGLR
jgi:ketosteroid isomerase-like protein